MKKHRTLKLRKEKIMNPNCDILYEDNSIIVCHKKAGIPVQTKDVRVVDMESVVKNYLSREMGIRQPYLAVVHRLDQPVEGVLVFAKTKAAAADLSRQISGKEAEKYYLAVTEGRFKEEKGRLKDFLLKDGRTNTSRVVNRDTPGSKEAVLDYEVLETVNDRQLVKIRLLTGRHHQIRVQLSQAGHPIVEDTKYNPLYQNRKGNYKISLCAVSISFYHPEKKEKVVYQICPDSKIFSGFTYCSHM